MTRSGSTTTSPSTWKYLAAFHCPSDDAAKFPEVGDDGATGGDFKGNYGMNWGQGVWGQTNTNALNVWGQPALVGPFERKPENTGVQFRQITDGLSSTLLFLEMIQAPASPTAPSTRSFVEGLCRIQSDHDAYDAEFGEADLIHQCIDRPQENLPCGTNVGWWDQRMASAVATRAVSMRRCATAQCIS